MEYSTYSKALHCTHYLSKSKAHLGILSRAGGAGVAGGDRPCPHFFGRSFNSISISLCPQNYYLPLTFSDLPTALYS